MSDQDNSIVTIKAFEDRIKKLEAQVITNDKLINNNKKVLLALLNSIAIKFLNQHAEAEEL